MRSAVTVSQVFTGAAVRPMKMSVSLAPVSMGTVW